MFRFMSRVSFGGKKKSTWKAINLNSYDWKWITRLSCICFSHVVYYRSARKSSLIASTHKAHPGAGEAARRMNSTSVCLRENDKKSCEGFCESRSWRHFWFVKLDKKKCLVELPLACKGQTKISNVLELHALCTWQEEEKKLANI